MKYVLVVLLALLSTDPREIAKINALKKEAENAFLAKDYESALAKYSLLQDSLGVDEDAIKLNIAHSHYQLDDTASAKSSYNQLSTSNDKKLKSVAYQQLGVMSKEAGKLEQALQQLKSAIKADPTNQDARYNYEVVKKLLEEQQQNQQNQDQQNQDQENQDQENQDQENQEQENQEQENQDQQNQDGEGEQDEEQQEQEGQQEEGEQKEGEEEQQPQPQDGEEQEQEKSPEQLTKEKLEEMNITEEKAQMILEALKNNEVQYLQQQKRKATERPKGSKPDW